MLPSCFRRRRAAKPTALKTMMTKSVGESGIWFPRTAIAGVSPAKIYAGDRRKLEVKCARPGGVYTHGSFVMVMFMPEVAGHDLRFTANPAVG